MSYTTQDERIEKIRSRSVEECHKLIFMWVKQNQINVKQYIELVELTHNKTQTKTFEDSIYPLCGTDISCDNQIFSDKIRCGESDSDCPHRGHECLKRGNKK